MATHKKVVPATFFMPGDKVLWKGILLTVHQVHENGSIEMVSQTMRVLVSDPSQLSHYTPIR